MCPITRWGSDLCFCFKPFITLDKRSQKISQIPFFRHSERGKSRTAVCLAIASLTRRTEARICTHTLSGKERRRHSWEVLRIGPLKVPLDEVPSLRPESVPCRSSLNLSQQLKQLFIKAVSKKCQNRSNIVQQRPSSVDYLIVLSKGQPYSAFRTKCSGIECK